MLANLVIKGFMKIFYEYNILKGLKIYLTICAKTMILISFYYTKLQLKNIKKTITLIRGGKNRILLKKVILPK